jgi:hypothetical protein
MHPRTKATIEQLKQAQWFRCVGVRDTDAAEVLSSWYEAVESCSSPEWEDLCMEAANQYRARLAERSPKLFRRWNDIVAELKPVTQALVLEKTGTVIQENDLPKTFLDTVDWDILNMCMEAEYADVYPPGFFASQAYWYVKGHFPCGWRGEFPKGYLVVY